MFRGNAEDASNSDEPGAAYTRSIPVATTATRKFPLQKIPSGYAVLSVLMVPLSIGVANYADNATMNAQKPETCDAGSQWAVPVPKTHIAGVPSWLLFNRQADTPALPMWLAANHPTFAVDDIVKANDKVTLSELGVLPAVSGGILCMTIPERGNYGVNGDDAVDPVTPTVAEPAPSVAKTSRPKVVAASKSLPLPRKDLLLPDFLEVDFKPNTTLTDSQLISMAYNSGFRGQAMVTIAAIARAESGGRVNAICRNTGHGCGAKPGTETSIDAGVLQINLKAHKVTMATAFNAFRAFDLGYTISNKGKSFRAWVAYNNGRHRKFMPAMIAAATKLGVY